jgi:CheY-like chemotaxis protein
VLIVDDDASTVKLIGLLLRCEHMQVEEATDGLHGLEALIEKHPDLVVLDMQMPEMDGRSFYKAARRVGYDGPIVVCSASGAHQAQKELGADAAIEKPFDPDELVSSIKELLPEEAS